MNVINDPDLDICGKPNFNSTVLESDERSLTREGSKNAESDALKLSPILKDHMQFMGFNGTPLSAKQHFHPYRKCLDLQNSDKKFKKIKRRDEASMSFVESNSNSTEAETIEIAVSETNVVEKSSQPKSNSTARSRVTNPFDSDIMRSLCATTFSPGLFNNHKKDVQCETPDKSFRWSIGQMADFCPAVIDETHSVYQTPDPVEEVRIKDAIDKFWASQKYVLPSPYCWPLIQYVHGVLLPEKESFNSGQEDSPSLIRGSLALVQKSPLARPPQARFNGSKQSVEVQTMFTFPPNLDLTRLLGHCFQYEKGEVAVFEANLSLNTLRRNLFLDSSLAHTNIESEQGDSIAMATDENYDENEPFKHGRPTWYHSNDEIMSSQKASFDGITDAKERTEISTRMLSPDISPIKN